MRVQNWSDDIIIADLPREPRLRSELLTLIELVRGRGDCDVLLDFARVSIMTSTSISCLLRLRKLLADCGHRLLFCNVPGPTKGVFQVVGLDEIFEWIDDKFEALASLQAVGGKGSGDGYESGGRMGISFAEVHPASHNASLN